MKLVHNGITLSVGYPLAIASLCAMIASPGMASAAQLQDTQSASESASSGAVVSTRANNAPVAAEKNETVYVFTESDGTPKNSEVSTTLVNKGGASTMADSSNLSDIENVEGTQGYTGFGSNMVWDAEGENVYYRGSTSASAPIDMKVTYRFNGSVITPRELAGKSGHVTIRYEYANNSRQNVEVNGSQYSVYTPFVVVTGMLLDNESFKNVKVTNGKAIDDGDRMIVVGYAMPGLQESLDVDSADIAIPEYFEVEADVSDFELKSTLTFASAGLLSDMDTSSIDTSELSDASGKLKDAMSQLVDGGSALSDGLSQLNEGVAKLAGGTSSLKQGADKLVDADERVAEGLDKATAAIGSDSDTQKDKTLIGGVNALKSGVDSEMLSPLQKIQKEVAAEWKANKTNITAAWESLQSLDAELKALESTISKIDDIDQGDLQTLGSKLNNLQTALDSANGSIDNALSMLDTLETIDFESVEKDLGSVQAGLEGAGGNLQDAAAKLQTAGGALSDAGSNLSADVSALREFAQYLPAEQQAGYAAALGKLVSDLQGDLGTAGAALGMESGIGADLGKAQKNLGTAGAGLAGAATTLQELKDSLPTEEQLKELRQYLNDAKAALTKENVSVMNDCLNALKTAMSKMDIGELNHELDLIKQHYPNIVKYIESQSAQEAYDELQGKLDKAVDGVQQVSDGLGAEKEGLVKLRDEGMKKLAEGEAQVLEGQQKLADGASDLEEGASKLEDGAASAADGSKKLAEGLAQFDEEGIGKVSELLDDNLLKVANRLQAVTEAGKSYTNFSGITDGTEGSVKFVFETDAISKS